MSSIKVGTEDWVGLSRVWDGDILIATGLKKDCIRIKHALDIVEFLGTIGVAVDPTLEFMCFRGTRYHPEVSQCPPPATP
jgi:hypothetical protein